MTATAVRRLAWSRAARGQRRDGCAQRSGRDRTRRRPSGDPAARRDGPLGEPAPNHRAELARRARPRPAATDSNPASWALAFLEPVVGGVAPPSVSFAMPGGCKWNRSASTSWQCQPPRHRSNRVPSPHAVRLLRPRGPARRRRVRPHPRRRVLIARCAARSRRAARAGPLHPGSAHDAERTRLPFIVTRRIGLATDAGCGTVVSGASSACCLWSAARRTVSHSAAGR